MVPENVTGKRSKAESVSSKIPNRRSWALLSVTDKTGLVDFAKELSRLGFGLLSTGGTAKTLRDAGLSVTEVAEVTGSPEILDGRVKTLHPKIHGAILFDRNNPTHVAEADRVGLGSIDLVIVNLYQFKKEAIARNLAPEEALEYIDIGGPAMLRAAAKNWLHVTPVVDPQDYAGVLTSLNAGGLSHQQRCQMAAKTFATVSCYDQMIAEYFAQKLATNTTFPETITASDGRSWTSVQTLRYGENSHQSAMLYAQAAPDARSGFGALEVIQGKELSYNNILDLDAATALACDLPKPGIVIVKHTNPCGVAMSQSDFDMSPALEQDRVLAQLLARAKGTDPKSAFGGIIATNEILGVETARSIAAFFVECVAAPEYTAEALEVLAKKPNIRVIRAPFAKRSDLASRLQELAMRSVRGALLVQTPDVTEWNPQGWRVTTKTTPHQSEWSDLVFAAIVAKHVKSNAIVFAKEGATIGIGAGQMSRIDSAQIAITKAKEAGYSPSGCIMASDAFFPFRDTVEFAASLGVKAIVQPGGSMRDQESIDAADQAGIAMVFCCHRHFRH